MYFTELIFHIDLRSVFPKEKEREMLKKKEKIILIFM